MAGSEVLSCFEDIDIPENQSITQYLFENVGRHIDNKALVSVNLLLFIIDDIHCKHFGFIKVNRTSWTMKPR